MAVVLLHHKCLVLLLLLIFSHSIISMLRGLVAGTLMERGPNLSEMKKEKEVYNNQLLTSSGKGLSNISTMPSWLLTNLADLEERMKMLAMGAGDNDEMGDTFAERAESYYQKRPQLLALLQDLYNGYVALSDRYVLAVAKQQHLHHRRHSSQISITDHDYSDQEEASVVISQADSDLESSLSYQQPLFLVPNTNDMLDTDAIVAELVIKNVEYELLVHEVCDMERRYSESSRKIELQKSLLEVLESERIILLNENAKLGYRVSAMMEENKGLASESIFMKRKAADLARCVLKMREDHRVYMLNRKIEDLQAQIYGLEKRNKEYYGQLMEKDNRNKDEINMKNKMRNRDGFALEVCLHLEKLSQRLIKRRDDTSGKGANVQKGSGWWKRVKNMDLFCGLNPTCT